MTKMLGFRSGPEKKITLIAIDKIVAIAPMMNDPEGYQTAIILDDTYSVTVRDHTTIRMDSILVFDTIEKIMKYLG